MNKSIRNDFLLLLFCAMIGAVAGIIFWIFLLLVNRGTWLLWDILPGALSGFKFYPLIICLVGGLLIGIVRKKFGDYPEDMMTVFGKLKTQKTYPYKKMLVIIIAALLPLIFGSSVGPEAGMVGIIVALCCWAGDNLKFAKKESAYYSRVGAEVSLSVMFHSPLFGILNVEEGEEQDASEVPISKGAKIAIYCVAAGAGFGCFFLLNHFVMKASSGFPSFEFLGTGTWDYVLFLVYVIAGIVLGLFFEYSEKLTEKIGQKLPPVVSELTAAAVLGLIACFLPVVQFSGEEAMGELISDYTIYTPLALIGIAFLKVIMTNICIQLGLKGGHFFPLIFSAVCFGYGISLLIFPGDVAHATFAAGIVTAGTLGVSMKKPLAVSMLLLLCFPFRSLLWIVPAAALAGFFGKFLEKKKAKSQMA
ncbi:MAG: chloride channel protein [Parasporobacterium sp.]|nr:chloride channel protein [Parasporobacterium sp.]